MATVPFIASPTDGSVLSPVSAGRVPNLLRVFETQARARTLQQGTTPRHVGGSADSCGVALSENPRASVVGFPPEASSLRSRVRQLHQVPSGFNPEGHYFTKLPSTMDRGTDGILPLGFFGRPRSLARVGLASKLM